ncbi:uncharacterized protein LOC108602144 [Drosophila busckii]|uniref:uncharacterized protein LOC108602144 n=1 Tax=Drosophila busckii TaxID=30019 RepID=UPI00083EB7CA|nr:uncharacterized protein LOC108602144 [Drosophila busckii]
MSIQMALLGLLLAFCWLTSVYSAETFNCNDVKPHPLDLSFMGGIWYEAARAPNVDVLQCLNVSVPTSVTDKLNLDLEYINTVGQQRTPVKEQVSFPWNNETQQSKFVLQFSNSAMTINVTYKVVTAVPRMFVILCGYSGISPMPLMKILTWERELDANVKQNLTDILEKKGVAKYLVWEEQSPDRCNAAQWLRPAFGVYTAVALLVIWRILKQSHIYALN